MPYIRDFTVMENAPDSGDILIIWDGRKQGSSLQSYIANRLELLLSCTNPSISKIVWSWQTPGMGGGGGGGVLMLH